MGKQINKEGIHTDNRKEKNAFAELEYIDNPIAKGQHQNGPSAADKNKTAGCYSFDDRSCSTEAITNRQSNQSKDNQRFDFILWRFLTNKQQPCQYSPNGMSRRRNSIENCPVSVANFSRNQQIGPSAEILSGNKWMVKSLQ